MADAAAGPSRRMKYPYTFTSKIVQFPLKFYIKNNWMWRYYFVAVVLTAPLFYKIQKATFSPNNVRVWEEKRKQEFTPGGHH